MHTKDAVRSIPALVASSDGHLTYDLGKRGVHARVDLNGPYVRNIQVTLERPSFERELEAKWGPGKETTHGIIEWVGPVWGASHSCTPKGNRCGVTFKRPARPLTVAFFGKTPQPIGALAGLEIGMSAGDAKAFAPQLVGAVEEIDNDGGVDDSRASVFIDDKTRRVNSMHLLLPNHALPLLREAWGKSRFVGKPSERRECWFGEVWRACASTGTELFDLDFQPHLLLATLLGDGTNIAYFTKHPLLGKTADEVARTFRIPMGSTDIDLPSSEVATATVEVDYDADDIVKSIELRIDYEPEYRDEVLQILSTKWKLRIAPPTDKQLTLRAKAPRIVAKEDRWGWRFTIME